MIITDLTQELDSTLRFASVPLSAALGYTKKQVETQWIHQISALLKSPGTIARAARSGSDLRGLMLCTPLPWDSEAIGKSMWAVKHLSANTPKVAEALVAEAVRCTRELGGDFLLCKSSTSAIENVHALEQQGFLWMDTLLHFVYEFPRKVAPLAKPVASGKFTIRLATADDLEALTQIADASFAEHFGRFHADPRIGREKATHVYRKWIHSCLNGWSDWVSVVVVEGRIAGYSAWKNPPPGASEPGLRVAHHSILGVHPDFFGRGIFSALTRHGMDHYSGNADAIEGMTHIDNHAVQRGYARLGWRIGGAQHSFHKWLKPEFL